MRAIAYIDGFNLYYQALKGTKLKWLDVSQACRLLFPTFAFVEYKYFTAYIRNRPGDPTQASRQQAYLKALRTIKGLSVYPGNFRAWPVWMPLYPVTHPPQTVRVLKTEEKMSDVNLATQLLCDAFANRFDCAVVFSSDGDLVMPLSVVRSEFKKKIAIVYPTKRVNKSLVQHSDHVKRLRRGVLSSSQFPDRILTARGIIEKPLSW